MYQNFSLKVVMNIKKCICLSAYKKNPWNMTVNVCMFVLERLRVTRKICFTSMLDQIYFCLFNWQNTSCQSKHLGTAYDFAFCTVYAMMFASTLNMYMCLCVSMKRGTYCGVLQKVSGGIPPLTYCLAISQCRCPFFSNIINAYYKIIMHSIKDLKNTGDC